MLSGIRPSRMSPQIEAPIILNSWGEEKAQPLHLLQSNLIMDCRFRRKAVIINIKTNRIMSMSCELDRRSDRLFESYERFSELSTEELQFALRIVHRELEKQCGITPKETARFL